MNKIEMIPPHEMHLCNVLGLDYYEPSEMSIKKRFDNILGFIKRFEWGEGKDPEFSGAYYAEVVRLENQFQQLCESEKIDFWDYWLIPHHRTDIELALKLEPINSNDTYCIPEAAKILTRIYTQMDSKNAVPISEKIDISIGKLSSEKTGELYNICMKYKAFKHCSKETFVKGFTDYKTEQPLIINVKASFIILVNWCVNVLGTEDSQKEFLESFGNSIVKYIKKKGKSNLSTNQKSFDSALSEML